MLYNDNAYVRIYGSLGELIAEPWYRDISIVGDKGSTPWQFWSWEAPSDGTYVLKYGVANATDGVYDSDALFDAGTASVNPGPGPATPEPGTLLLIGTGLAGLAGYSKLRLRRRK